jgi:hypothetical protein
MPGYGGVNLPARSIETQEKKEEPVPETHIKTTRARRGQATDPHSIAERVRWTAIYRTVSILERNHRCNLRGGWLKGNCSARNTGSQVQIQEVCFPPSLRVSWPIDFILVFETFLLSLWRDLNGWLSCNRRQAQRFAIRSTKDDLDRIRQLHFRRSDDSDAVVHMRL